MATLSARQLYPSSDTQLNLKSKADRTKPQADNVLLIIDMQPKFASSNEPALLSFIEHLILQAIEEEAVVICLEYGYGSRTNTQLTRHLKGYARYFWREKNADDGASEVSTLCAKKVLSPIAFKVVGVNTHACVSRTTESLAKAFPSSQITVMKNGCNCKEGNHWDDFPKASNIALSDYLAD